MEYMYLKRNIDVELLNWKKDSSRKPLLMRGARQVGKSTSVREFAKSFRYYVEVNFEEREDVCKLFDGNLSPKEICANLSIYYDTPIIPGETLVFFDEIQSCIRAISSLRFFYEKYPELHIIAAGSLLEFALNELPSFGVGRIRTMFIHPLSFDEFLTAAGDVQLLDAKNKATLQNPLTDLLHDKLISLLKKFMVLGGMPEVIANYFNNKNIHECQRSLDDLILSLKSDFAKYKSRVPALRILEIFESVSGQMGNKFVYKKADTQANHKQIKETIELLLMSGLVISVTHSSGNGIPLGAEADNKKRKMLIFDTGIFQRLLGLDIKNILFENDFDLINKGAIAELFTGLEILKSSSCYEKHDLYYWQRETPSSSAEIDYLLQLNENIIPVEVKSSKKGSMKSLFVFLNEKKRDYGIRFSMENFSTYNNIRIYPLYAVSNLFRKV